MEHAVTHRSVMDPNMISTKNRGQILSRNRARRDTMSGGRSSRNASQQPAEFIVGPHNGLHGDCDIHNHEAMDGSFPEQETGPWTSMA